jgi:hypothetical protein
VGAIVAESAEMREESNPNKKTAENSGPLPIQHSVTEPEFLIFKFKASMNRFQGMDSARLHRLSIPGLLKSLKIWAQISWLRGTIQ